MSLSLTATLAGIAAEFACRWCPARYGRARAAQKNGRCPLPRSGRWPGDLRQQQMNALGAQQSVMGRPARWPVPGTGRPRVPPPPGSAWRECRKPSPVRASRTLAPSTRLSAQQQFFRRDMIGDGRAMGVGIDQAFQRDAFGRIHLGVVIFEGALKAWPSSTGSRASASSCAQPAMAGHFLRRIVQPVAVIGKQIIKRQPGAPASAARAAPVP